jgi:hypothetical protein
VKKYENPAQTGLEKQKPDINISSVSPAVKSPLNENLMYFHSVFADLAPEEYKMAMSAICQYLADGTVPPLTGLLKVVVTLALDRIATQASAPRKRGGQRGNQNARKADSSDESESKKTNKNESKTNKIESSRTTVVPVATPTPTAVASTATPSSPVAVAPPNLNLNLNNNINFKYLNYLNCEHESENEKRNRIKNALKRFGFTLSDKSVNKVISSVPDPMWLVQGVDFPSYLAQYVTERYKGKGKTQLELQKLFLSALNAEKWETPWQAYPNWLSERMEAVLVDKEAMLRKIPPQKTCPDCGENAPLDGLRCPKCGGFYQWDETTHSHGFVHHLNLNFAGAFDRLLELRRKKQQEENHAAFV